MGINEAALAIETFLLTYDGGPGKPVSVQVRPSGEAPDDLGGRLLARKLAEVLLDVLNFERALFELVLGDVVFHPHGLIRLGDGLA